MRVHIEDADTVRYVYRLLREEGLFVGSTSGINVAAAVRVARELGPGHTVVTVLCDTGSKYLSRLFNRDWLMQKGLLQAGQVLPPATMNCCEIARIAVAGGLAGSRLPGACTNGCRAPSTASWARASTSRSGPTTRPRVRRRSMR